MTNTNDKKVYNRGEDAILSITVVDANGNPATPNSLTLRTRDPAGLIVEQAITNPTPGTYIATWKLDVAGRWRYEWVGTNGDLAKFGEFDVLPSPLDDPSRGAIALLVQGLMPLTWDGLYKADYYGPARLADRIQSIKYTLLPEGVAKAAAEENLGFVLREYLAKSVARDLINPGIEYWMRQRVTVSATGTNETNSFSDPINALKELDKRLTVEIEQLKANPALATALSQPREFPSLSDGSDNGIGLVTISPFDYPPQFS